MRPHRSIWPPNEEVFPRIECFAAQDQRAGALRRLLQHRRYSYPLLHGISLPQTISYRANVSNSSKRNFKRLYLLRIIIIILV